MITELLQSSSSSNIHWTEETVPLKDRWAADEFLWCLIAYVKRWADED